MKKLLLASLCFLLLCLTQVHAQNRTVTGTVTAKDDGLPIPGVSVKIKGTSSGTQTNAAGKFSLSVSPGAVLSFSFIGYNTQDVAVGTKSTIEVVLLSANSQLNEVVVTALGIQRQAISVGYSTSKVTGKDITQAKPISVTNGLTGKVSGLQVTTTNNGLFAPTRVTLRGNRSLIGNNQPLYVVDGSIFYSDISTLNPEDIAETTVLKGSSASAVYGSDASNGVIVITTKHGAKGTSALTVSSTYQIEKVSYIPEYQTRFGANGGEGEVFDFSKFVDEIDGHYNYYPYENQSYGPEFNGKLVPIGRPLPDGSSELVPYSAVKNQKKDFFDTGITTQHNFNFTSGEENGSFYMSGQDLHSKSIMPKDEGRRDVFRVGGDKKYGAFSTSYSVAYTYLTKNQTNTGAVYNDLIESPVNIPVKDLRDPTSKYGNPDTYYNDYYISPGQIINESRYTLVENHIQANLQANLKVAKFLTLSYRTSLDNTSGRSEAKDAGRTYSDFTKNAETMIYPNNSGGLDTVENDGAGHKYAANDLLPSYGTSDYTNLLFSSDFLANYNFKLPADFKIDGTLGVAYLDNKVTATTVNQGSINFLPYNTQNLSSVPSLSEYSLQARKLGYFGTATLGYKSYAFIHGSYRTDLDSRLSSKNKYIGYYDIDGSVVLSEIFKDIANNDYLNFVKVRYAHSKTGNASALSGGSQYIAFGAYRTIPTVGLAGGFPYSSTGISGYSLSGTIANPDIKPETVTEDEVGLDLGFLKDRLTLTASAYKSTTKDGIVTAQISRASGFTSALLNAANSENKGLELDLHGTVISSQAVKWTLGVNYTKQSSKVISIVSGVNELSLGGNTFAVKNLPYAQIKGYDWNRDPATGKVIVDATTGLPVRASATQPLGNVNPTDLLGFTSSLSYKGFTLNLTIDYRSGYKIFNAIGSTLDHSGNGVTTTLTGRQRFVFPNSVYKDASGKYVDNTNILTQDGNYNFFPTTWLGVDANYVISAAAWKLREASLNYNFPKAWLRDVKFIKNVNVAVSGRNLLMFRPSTNKFTDPEFNDDTSNAVGRTTLNQAPPTRIISGTLAVTF
ncbi:SusC/RagA family TonB-linked outer membrane protein [Mucilaginibacter sp. OK283]|uniref:SusC/RagA family TonB-linked outer membrane protein n=1 Tax=Mucilaginibacter sp. OK283 TaxID=1881049 RepID=UPI0008C89944|nr:SusC/RagA family TonB-linked outer membrane protein [Mucilaginibacter sp. OK283]SEO09866.1 TonB-linked outer membrane protein, SusC/RagA family [Mucilaginibacter sp. OK283]